MKIIYKNKKITSEILLFEAGGVVYYHKTTLFEKIRYQMPIERFDNVVSFSRAYHAPFFILPVSFSILSVRLIMNKWHTQHWTLYSGFTVLALIVLGLVYYFMIGKKTGVVELNIGDSILNLYMTLPEFIALKENLDQLK